MAGNAKHKRRVKLRRASRSVTAFEERRIREKDLGRSLDRFAGMIDAPLMKLAITAAIVRRIQSRS